MKRLMLLVLALSACTTVPTAPTTPATPTTPVTKPAMDFAAIVKSNPGCSGYKWKDRGYAPVGYIKGVAMAYAKSMCRYNSASATAAGVMGQAVSSKIHSSGFPYDALFNYGLKADTGGQRIKQIYTLELGLGMRESSGNYGVGVDTTAGKETPEEAETGLLQFSYNSISASPWLKSLYAEYQANPALCNLDVFKEGAKAPSTDYVGSSGAAYDFQKFVRSCPGLAAEYAAVGLRVLEPHWGPARRKEAEYLPACEQMLSQVEVALVCK